MLLSVFLIGVLFFSLSYRVNDIVLFHPVKVGSSYTDVRLNLVHLQKPRPYAFLHEDCYSLFNFKIGKMYGKADCGLFHFTSTVDISCKYS